MMTPEPHTRRFSHSSVAFGILSTLTTTVALSQQPVATFRGPAVRQSAPRTMAPIETPRMGMLEFTPRQVDSFAHITIVGGVARPMVIRSQLATVSLDAVIQRAGGLAKEATGAVTIVRHGQPRMNLFYTPGAGTTLIPGDTVILSARPAGLSATEQARSSPPRVAVICHNIQPHPAILWVPESQASAEEIARALGQGLESLPPRGVVLPAARPTISATLLLPTGTSLYFDPARIDRARLAQALSSGLKFEDVVEFEPSQATVDLNAPGGQGSAPPIPLPLPPSTPSDAVGGLFAPALPTSTGESLENVPPPAVPGTPFGTPTATAPAAVTSLVPASSLEPARVASAPSHRIEMVRDSSAVAASLERVIPDETSPSRPPQAELSFDSLEAELTARPQADAGNPTVNRAAFGWGLGAGILVGALAGLYLWLRSRLNTKKTVKTIADLPLTEEPAAIRPQPVHGKVIGDRRLAFDAPHERPASPHFAAAHAAARPLVQAGAKSKAGSKSKVKGTGRVSSKETSETPAAPVEAGAKLAPADGGTSASNGLLDRVLRVMQREKGE